MTTSTKRLVVIVGRPGSGKTDLSIRIALHYGAPILSTDSRQMYRGLPIGTGSAYGRPIASRRTPFYSIARPRG